MFVWERVVGGRLFPLAWYREKNMGFKVRLLM